jgi:HEAT repeat protein
VWRRFGDVSFAFLVALAVTLEAVPLAFMTWVLLGRFVGSSSGPRLGTVLLGALASVALALIMITGYILAYQYVSDRHEEALAERRREWTARWLRVLFRSEEAPPPGPLSKGAIDALLDLKDAVRGSEADRMTSLLQRYEADVHLERGARFGRVPARLEALDGLARARIAGTLPTLIAAMGDPEPVVRVAAARASARTLARIEEPLARDHAAAEVVAAMERSRLPVGVVEEVLLLAEDAASSLIGALLLRQDAPIPSIRAALDGIARQQLITFGEETARFLDHADPEVRAAALRAIGRIGLLLSTAHSRVLEALEDDVDFVRIHAAGAARLLPGAQARAVLSKRLGDRSWWVRRAAADALGTLGPAGLGELGQAARSHPDRYARDMAAQTLRDHGPEVVAALSR